MNRVDKKVAGMVVNLVDVLVDLKVVWWVV